MFWLGVTVAFLAGISLPLQAGINSLLARSAGTVGSTIWASFVSFVIGGLALLGFFIVQRHQWPSFSDLSKAPVYAWSGGLFGAFFVFAATTYAPKLGAVIFIAVLLTGQMIASLVLDHTAKLGFEHSPVSLVRVLGIGLIICGVLLIQMKKT